MMKIRYLNGPHANTCEFIANNRSLHSPYLQKVVKKTKPSTFTNNKYILAIALCSVVQFTFINNKWKSYFVNHHARVFEMVRGPNKLFSLTWMKIIENSLTIPGCP